MVSLSDRFFDDDETIRFQTVTTGDAAQGNTESGDVARTSVRQALGAAAHAMSDQEIDAVIVAAQGGVPPAEVPARTDSDPDLSDAISDDDLDQLAAADAEANAEWDIDDDA